MCCYTSSFVNENFFFFSKKKNRKKKEKRKKQIFKMQPSWMNQVGRTNPIHSCHFARWSPAQTLETQSGPSCFSWARLWRGHFTESDSKVCLRRLQLLVRAQSPITFLILYVLFCNLPSSFFTTLYPWFPATVSTIKTMFLWFLTNFPTFLSLLFFSLLYLFSTSGHTQWRNMNFFDVLNSN